MKYKPYTLAVVLLLSSCMTQCSAPSDPEFMKNAAASIHGGPIETPAGVMMAPGLQNRNRVHPFFGSPE